MPSGFVTPAGGGFARPSQWTIDSDGGLTQAISDTAGLNNIHVAAQQTTNIEAGVTNNGDGSGRATVRVSATAGGSAVVAAQNGNVDGDSATLSGYGGLSLFTTAGQKAIDAWDAAGNVQRFGLLVAGQIMTGVVAAPADGALAASQLAFWFDDTNGAAKLKIKGKSADGTVVTGTVNLA